MAGRDPTVTKPHGRPAWSRIGGIGDYDGAADKTDCETELVPYAWTWYQDITAMLGTAFTRERTGVIHAKKLTLARGEAAKTRTVERAVANSLPSTSDELLGTWAKILRVPAYANDERWQVRQRCAARFSAPNGPNAVELEDSLRALLGNAFVGVHRNQGTLDEPPDPTYWSENPGAPGLSLGSGTWTSVRSRIVVNVTLPADAELGAFLRTVNTSMHQHLDRVEPAWQNHSWTTWDPGSTGFFLDSSRMDLVAFD